MKSDIKTGNFVCEIGNSQVRPMGRGQKITLNNLVTSKFSKITQDLPFAFLVVYFSPFSLSDSHGFLFPESVDYVLRIEMYYTIVMENPDYFAKSTIKKISWGFYFKM